MSVLHQDSPLAVGQHDGIKEKDHILQNNG